ncbi:uncharacterized protein THITE_2130190 [Thermothielavioides terrestris NRRL 8126]|uniref:C2H2-type domain-containing protein n=1 Tax=Thermothielavioides terrestris (strain ATCC 38088 / NRRL 8126) TaxID=578455 RepID=G2R6B4_THETT|nr:uncharacterized protein THITE_2130190 [Thermothielavioides terrestris NRRL 8126]AEO68447.1 hypothetical protein THITE_2130190 [Thermothielavioides terrestris NRRL 8126]
MTNLNADGAGIDPDLNTQFSHLSMSQDVGLDASVDPSSWPADTASFSSPPAGAGPDASHAEQLNYNDVAAAQSATQPSPLDVGTSYAGDTALPTDAPTNDDSSQAGPSSSNPAGPEKPFICHYQGCGKAYKRQCDLERRHCDLCPAGTAQTRDLNRHMWVHHRDEARARGLPREADSCGECGYSGRRDNVKRHRDMKGHR